MDRLDVFAIRCSGYSQRPLHSRGTSEVKASGMMPAFESPRRRTSGGTLSSPIKPSPGALKIYVDRKDFKRRFLRALRQVLILYPSVRVEQVRGVIRFKPAPCHVQRPIEQKVVYQLGRIGTNLNQLTRLANTTGRIDYRQRLAAILNELTEAIRRLV